MTTPYVIPGTALPEKVAPAPAAPSSASAILDSFTNLLHPVAQPLAATFDRFHNWKENMGLIQPGTVENLTRDVTRE
jgi:mitochondrial import receptor subunit TOM40